VSKTVVSEEFGVGTGRRQSTEHLGTGQFGRPFQLTGALHRLFLISGCFPFNLLVIVITTATVSFLQIRSRKAKSLKPKKPRLVEANCYWTQPTTTKPNNLKSGWVLNFCFHFLD